MNVPTSITLENLNSTPTATFRTKLFGAENDQVKEAINKYELSINTIPTKEIRIFSAADNSIRTVKVNTELILGTNISSNDEQNRSGTLYLFNNKNGSISLITPNYAGNVTDDQKDVMLEVIQ
ncbi:lipoprotein [Enterococcus faecalis]|nr:lipoprotein [Enterococcus faecalis]